MSKEKILEKIELLKTQRQQAKEVFIKCEGAIEVLKDLVSSNDKKDERKK
jgi:hypothetical protein